jgi:hypothetical protein
MQVSLGRRPHRFERSQSPQLKSDERRIAAIRAETVAMLLRIALVTTIGLSSVQNSSDQKSIFCGSRQALIKINPLGRESPRILEAACDTTTARHRHRRCHATSGRSMGGVLNHDRIGIAVSSVWAEHVERSFQRWPIDLHQLTAATSA